MPLWQVRCLNEHIQTIYAHNVVERACRTILCPTCQQTMSPVFSPGTALTWFAEGGGGRWIHNLGPEPVFVTSHAHHKQLMKAAGVDWAPPRRGMPGQWV